jgi:peptidoglycan hydrolase CwlO-like protein
MLITKPKILVDIKTSRISTYGTVSTHVNLSPRQARFRVSGMVKGFLFLLVLTYALFGTVVAPSLNSLAAAPSAEERQQLEQELSVLESQIEDYEATVAAYRKQGNSLKNEISSLTAKIEKVNLQIKVINLSLSRLSAEIADNQVQIKTTQDKLDFSRSAMTSAIQVMYESEQTSLMTVLLQNPNLSDFFGDINNLIAVQDGLTTTMQQINELKDELLDEQDQLIAKKADTTAIKKLQDEQRKAIAALKLEKDSLLKTTKGQENTYQALVKQKRESAAKIRNRIFELLGGGEMTFEQAFDFAKFAEKATDVPATLLLAVLDRESALGKNVGKCSYRTAMAPGAPKSKRDDVTPFLSITSELGLDPDKTLVSCAISTDGAYGGAMGPAQFIPTTWMLYRDRIATITGATPPSPWRNSDAFVGTALYLKDALSACGSYSGDTRIRCAAARYYAGGNWKKHLYTYGSATLSRQKKFIDDVAVLESNGN